MRMSKTLNTLALAAALCAGCGANPNSPETTFPATLTLRAGQTSSAGGLGVTFVGVTNDWRCPAAAICISSGDAYLKFVLAANNGLADSQLQVEHPDYRRTTYGGYRLEVQKLEPYPITYGSIKPDEYVATVTITRQ